MAAVFRKRYAIFYLPDSFGSYFIRALCKFIFKEKVSQGTKALPLIPRCDNVAVVAAVVSFK